MPDPSLVSPVSSVPGDEDKPLEAGIAVCLSGGGYRAMLFHTGSLLRLIEMGLVWPESTDPGRQFKRISSVSGGSIVSAMLGLKWTQLDFSSSAAAVESFKELVVRPIRDLASITLASGTLEGAVKVLSDIAAPGSVNDRLADAYDEHLFKGANLKSLPASPRWVINASNLQSGALWRFMNPYMRDWKVGENTHTDKIRIAQAVAASSAFPPILAPATLDLKDTDFTPSSGAHGLYNLQRPPYTTDVQLVDGGVYDNLGLETAYKRYRTLLVSDAGAPFEPKKDVPRNWVGLGKRVIDLVDNQVRALRKRLLIHSLNEKARLGAFWDMDVDIGVFQAPSRLPCLHERTLELSAMATDLGKKNAIMQKRLINWGYAVCDASVRSRYDGALPIPADFPYPDIGVS